jgi:hypothetical protein
MDWLLLNKWSFVLRGSLSVEYKLSPRNENMNLLIRIKFLNLLHIYVLIKTEKFTVRNKVLLVLGWRTSAHHEDCKFECTLINSLFCTLVQAFLGILTNTIIVTAILPSLILFVLVSLVNTNICEHKYFTQILFSKKFNFILYRNILHKFY